MSIGVYLERMLPSDHHGSSQRPPVVGNVTPPPWQSLTYPCYPAAALVRDMIGL